MTSPINSLQLVYPATDENFDESAYLISNPDVARAVKAGSIPDGRTHFERNGRSEGRTLRLRRGISELRTQKMRGLRPHLRLESQHEWLGDKVSFLTKELADKAGVTETENVSSNGYDVHVISMVARFPQGLVLDCGAGLRDVYYQNVVNFEIVNYDTTDVLGIGETLPFYDNTFDAIISVAVLEHVRDPFRCAREIARVLKPGGELYCALPFLQPLHGYPNHYFNATHQGLRCLFEDHLDITEVFVPDSTHPIFSLRWIIQSWSQGITDATREHFLNMPIGSLLGSPAEALARPFCRELSADKRLELASAVVLRANKAR